MLNDSKDYNSFRQPQGTNTRCTEREMMSEEERLNEYFDRIIQEAKKKAGLCDPAKPGQKGMNEHD